ncbi:ABC transporter substrate-binding protein [Chloroflexota bacterium]
MKNSKRMKTLVALVLVFILVLGGCQAAAPTTPTPTPTPTPTGPHGDLAIAVTSFSAETLTPWKGQIEDAAIVQGPIYDFLARIHMDGPLEGQIGPDGIAYKWEMDPDGLSYTYYIREGIKFQNGEDLTAEDVKFSLDQNLRPDVWNEELRVSVESVELVDDYTLRVHTQGIQVYFPWMVLNAWYAFQGQVVPKDYYEEVGDEGFDRNPIGSGPYKFVKQVLGDRVEYEAVDEHWRKVPEFKNLSILKVPDQATRAAMLRTGQVDLIEVGMETAADLLEKDGFKTASMNRGVDIGIRIHGAYAPKAIKENNPFTDLRVRKAVSLAIDRQELIDLFFLGQGTIPGPPTISAASGDIDWPYWKDYAKKMWVYDLDEAKRLMAEAGYPDGFDVGTKIYTQNSDRAPFMNKLSEIVQAYLGEIGIVTEITPVEMLMYKEINNELISDEIIGHIAMRDQDMAPVTPHELEGTFATWDTVVLLNLAFPEVDEGIEYAFSELDPVKRQAALAKVIKICTDTYTNIVFASVPILTSVGPRLEVDFPVGTQGVGLFVEYYKHAQ